MGHHWGHHRVSGICNSGTSVKLAFQYARQCVLELLSTTMMAAFSSDLSLVVRWCEWLAQWVTVLLKCPVFEFTRGGVQSYKSGHINIIQFRYWLEPVCFPEYQGVRKSGSDLCKNLYRQTFGTIPCLDNREVCKIIQEVINRGFHSSEWVCIIVIIVIINYHLPGADGQNLQTQYLSCSVNTTLLPDSS